MKYLYLLKLYTMNQLLLPNQFKITGWFILITSIILGVAYFTLTYTPAWLTVHVFSVFNDEAPNGFSGIIENDVTDEIISCLLILGAILVGFSKEKQEDEGIAMLRLNSLMWAVLVNYIILFLAIIFVYDIPFLKVLTYNMFTVLLIFIGRFHFMLYRKFKYNLA